MTERDLRERLDALEWRLDQYHEQLESSLEHNAHFQLSATWGVVGALNFGLCFLGGSFLFTKAWEFVFDSRPGWIGGSVIAVSTLALCLFIAGFADRGREDDKRKLARWPRWRR